MIYDLLISGSPAPDRWRVVSIKDLADVLGGGTPDTNVPAYWNPPEVPWVTPTDITASPDPILFKTERSISQAGLKNSSAALLPIGTTLLTSRATVGECRVAGVEVATNQGFASLVPKEKTDPDFLFYLGHFAKPAFVRLAAGTTFLEVSRREVRRVKVYAPTDPDEMKAIGRALKTADVAIQTANTELEKAKKLKTSLLQQLFTKGLPGRYPEMVQGRVFKSEFMYPSPWTLERLGLSVLLVAYGTNAPANEYAVGYPVIAIPQVVSSVIGRGDWPYADVPHDEAQQLRLHADDVLLIRTNGNPDYIGKSTVISEELAKEHLVFASYLIRVRTDQSRLLGSYLNLFLSSPLGRRQCLALANTSAGNHNLGARSLKQILIPRPPVDEQKEALGLMTSVETAITRIQEKVVALERLRIALLQNLLTGRIRLGKAATA